MATTLPLSVAEYSPIDTILLVLHATDEDYGTNADVTYNITAGNGAGDFILKIDNDANLACLAINGDLVTKSTSSYTLTITASNSMPLADATPATDTVSHLGNPTYAQCTYFYTSAGYTVRMCSYSATMCPMAKQYTDCFTDMSQ